jgi:hypothetical protein
MTSLFGACLISVHSGLCRYYILLRLFGCFGLLLFLLRDARTLRPTSLLTLSSMRLNFCFPPPLCKIATLMQSYFCFPPALCKIATFMRSYFCFPPALCKIATLMQSYFCFPPALCKIATFMRLYFWFHPPLCQIATFMRLVHPKASSNNSDCMLLLTQLNYVGSRVHVLWCCPPPHPSLLFRHCGGSSGSGSCSWYPGRSAP